jgi:hypothetical protein
MEEKSKCKLLAWEHEEKLCHSARLSRSGTGVNQAIKKGRCKISRSSPFILLAFQHDQMFNVLLLIVGRSPCFDQSTMRQITKWPDIDKSRYMYP